MVTPLVLTVLSFREPSFNIPKSSHWPCDGKPRGLFSGWASERNTRCTHTWHVVMNFLAFNFNKKIPKSGHFPSAVAWQWLTSLWSLRHFAPIPSSTNLGAGQQRQLNHGSNGGIEPGHTRHPTDSPTARLSCWAVVPIGPMMSRCRLVLVAGLDIVQTHPSPIVWRNNNTSSSWSTAIKSVLINSPDLPSITYSLTVIKLFPRNNSFQSSNWRFPLAPFMSKWLLRGKALAICSMSWGSPSCAQNPKPFIFAQKEQPFNSHFIVMLIGKWWKTYNNKSVNFEGTHFIPISVPGSSNVNSP